MFFPAIFSRATQIENVLPQTQCQKCGYSGCRPYAEAIANNTAVYNQCPPGGELGIQRLAVLLQKPFLPLNLAHGAEHNRTVAVIDESKCIGCTLCIQVCPVDAIVGAAKQLHTVLENICTGCDLCAAACPVDCISFNEIQQNKSGWWDSWTVEQAHVARDRYNKRLFRLNFEKNEQDAHLVQNTL